MDLSVVSIASYIAIAVTVLGITGNILSAFVWLKHCITKKNSSAVYLATLAVVDLVAIVAFCVAYNINCYNRMDALCTCVRFITRSAAGLEPLLVLCFSVERLFAILRPMQVKVVCTPSRATKIVTSVILVVLILEAVRTICQFQCGADAFDHMFLVYNVIYALLVPISILIINILVAYKVRRASQNATAVSLGRNQHPQSTYSNSAVPTVMLLATSFIYVALLGACTLASLFLKFSAADIELTDLVISDHVAFIVLAYNFIVYVITGKQFRHELRQLVCCLCDKINSSHNSADAANNVDVPAKVPRVQSYELAITKM